MVSNWKWVKEFLAEKGQKEDASEPLKGYYNHNYVLKHRGEYYLVRVPISQAEMMDIRAIPENMVLKWLAKKDFEAPHLLFNDPQGRFSVHSFIEGTTLSDIYPRETNFPDWIPKRLGKMMRFLHSLTYPDRFKIKCADYINSINLPKDSAFFLSRKIEFLEGLYKKMLPEYRKYYEFLKIPKDPFSVSKSQISLLKPRKFVFAHCDVHRKNLMIHKINSGDKEKKRIVFLDWELCLITDPYYDLGVHLHKMRYEPHQEEIFLSEYLQKPPKSKEYKAALREIKIYEEVEIIRTVLVDIQRASLDFSVANTEARKEIITSHYFHKFKKSFGLFGMIPSVEKSDIRNMLVQIRSELF